MSVCFRRLHSVVSILSVLVVTSCTIESSDPAGSRRAGPYLGQTPPGTVPQLFAPGLVSTGLYTRDVTMTPDGAEFYFGVLESGFAVIVETELVNGRWTEPRVAPFSSDPRFMNLEPHISPDGQRFFFLSTRPPDGREPAEEEIGAWVNEDIWVMDRTADGWSEPYNLGAPVNTAAPEFYPSVTLDGTIYFTREDKDPEGSFIYRARLVDSRYTEPERLPPEVNSTTQQYNAFIAPDERYLIVCVAGREDGRGGTDYYVVFRDADDRWTGPINLGEMINRERGAEWSPYVSPDGKYFFFMSTRQPDRTALERVTLDYLHDLHNAPGAATPGIYWVEAGFIEALRPAD